MGQGVERDTASRPDDATQPSDPHRRMLLLARWSLERARESDREFRRLVNRRIKKLEYRRMKETAGTTIRENRDLSKLLREPGETEDDFHRRIRRDAARERRGVNAQTVRPYTKLSGLSEQERQKHKAERSRERKRKQRALMKQKLIQNVTKPSDE